MAGTASTEGRGGAVPSGDPAANRAMMDRIAAAFDESRSAPWPQVEHFLVGLPRGARVLDLAAGNGRHSVAAVKAGLRPLAVEVAHVLPRRLRSRAIEMGLSIDVVEADALSLPLGDGSVPDAMFIAGLHAIQGRTERVRSLRELHRVLQRGGTVLISVWSREQDRFRHKVTMDLPPSDNARGGREPGDVDVPWSFGVDAPVPRFFHLYLPEELREDVEAAGFEELSWEAATLTKSSRPDNYFVTVRKR